MISKKKLSLALRDALDKADPNQVPYPAIKRERITYPICHFTHALKAVVGTYQQITDVSFNYDEETIQKERTVCILKTESMRIRLTYEHQRDRVTVFCVGRNIDGVTKNVHVNNLAKELEEFFTKEEPKKVVVKKIIVRKRASPKPS